MGSGPRDSKLSGTTAFDSSASLNTLSTAKTGPPANGQVMATSNIINQKADASRSLYQICVALKQRLALVPGFEVYLQQMEEWAADMEDGGPVGSLWRSLRTGLPLLTIWNTLRPDEPLKLPEHKDDRKRAQIAILNFGTAVKKLSPPPPQEFIINDVMGTDTTGLMKVCFAHRRPTCPFLIL